jgi:PAS domain S-box-containing protein
MTEVSTYNPIIRQPYQYKQEVSMLSKNEELVSLLKGILNASPDFIFAKDTSFKYIACNNAFGELIKRAPDDILGYTDAELFNDSEQAKRVRVADSQLLTTQKIIRLEEWATYPDGRRVLLDTLKSPFYNKEGNLIGLLGVCRDVTDRVASENELRVAKNKAEKATEAKSDFLARMSHEIRTPMNAVIGLTHLTLKTQLNHEQRDYLNKILSSGESLLNLLNDILDFSKIEAGKLNVEHTPFNLHELVNRSINLTAMEAHAKGLELITQVESNVPTRLLGDPFRLQQVLVNLLNNAAKFTENGSIYLNITIDKKTEELAVLQCSVTDTGIGMNEQQQEKLFQSFNQADDTITRKYGGTGLGLAIAKQLTELMGGKIWLKSQLQQGSTFYFTTQVGQVQDSTLVTDCLPIDFPPLKVLIVDDIPLARTVLADFLAECGIQVNQTDNGAHAIDLISAAQLNNQAYDLVFMDWRMPEMDGIQTSKQISQLPTETLLKPLPKVLMVSAYDKDAAIHAALTEQVDIARFIEKPLSKATLIAVLKNTLLTHVPQRNVKEEQTESLTKAPDFSTSRVLLVDDNEMNLLVAKTFLADTGVQLDIAYNGLQAIDKIQQTNYDLVLMDIQMPEMDGLTACKKIRTDLQLTELPIIAMTAHAMEKDIENSRAVGMNEHIIKPIHPDDLFSMLNRFLPTVTCN